jgi:hypothetical protein
LPRPLALALLLLLGGACRRAELADGVSDSVFVATMTELRQVQANATLDSAGRAAARDAALRRHRVNAAQLERAAAALADDPERASNVWTEIERRLSAPPEGEGR